MATLKGKCDVAPLECLLCVLPNASWKHLEEPVYEEESAERTTSGPTAEVKRLQTGPNRPNVQQKSKLQEIGLLS